MTLNAHGEVANFAEADQFPTGKSQFACGFFAVAMAKSMAKVPNAPILSPAQIISLAGQWYTQYDGADIISNTYGMTVEQEYALLQQVGLHYQAIAMDANMIRTWLKAGYPVIVAVYETSVHDKSLGGACPYPWQAAGTHVILLTGVTSDGNFLAHDSANCTNLYDPNSLRPGPRTYDANALQYVSATVVVPPWLERPDNATTPPDNEEETVKVLTIKDVESFFVEDTVNKRWYLRTPNSNYKSNYYIGGDILKYYCVCSGTDLNGMSQFGLPDGYEYKVPGKKRATIQIFERGAILFDPDGEVDSVPGVTGACMPAHVNNGLALQLLSQPLIKDANSQISAQRGQIAALNTQISQLQTQLAAAQAANHQDEVDQLTKEIAEYKAAIKDAQANLASVPA